jgi:4'-phosphopantetheinyl transferase
VGITWGAFTSPPVASAPAAGECHLWPVAVVARTPWGSLLDADERAQADRFVVDHARDTFRTSRVAQRVIAARYLDISPAAVRIDRTCRRCGAQHGRPGLLGAAIDFSVTHTRDWVVLAVVGKGRVGVDLEDVATARDLDSLIMGTLTAAERETFAVVPPPERAGWFLRLWTRKEAAVKLTGHGLAAGMGALDTIGPIAVAMSPPPDWPVEPIHLRDIPVGGGLIAAVATTVPLTKVTVCGPVDLTLGG